MEKKSIEDKLRDGDYKCKLPYANRRVDPQASKAYHEETNRLYEEFKTDVLVDLGLLKISASGTVSFKHPKADLLWEKAWDRGHSDGFQEVWNVILDLKDLLD